MKTSDEDTLRPEYDLKSLGKGVRGKFYERYQRGTNVVVIEPDPSKVFPNAEAEMMRFGKFWKVARKRLPNGPSTPRTSLPRMDPRMT